MDWLCTREPGLRRGVVVIGILAFIMACHAYEMHAQSSGKSEKAKTKAREIRDVRSRHFLIHTDLSSHEADEVAERLEAVLGHISKYWGQPLRGVIECNVISDLGEFPAAGTAPEGVRGVKTCGGVTLMYFRREGRRQVGKSVVYSAARLEVVQHEAVHAYCHQTFGRLGPIWYSEGMAEMAHYWEEGDSAVHADLREIDFLHTSPPNSLATVVSLGQVTGDCWQNYASRWALCHFLFSNPNYSQQFRQLGRGFLTGRDVSFEQTYAATTRELSFEYLFFLEHISRGYRVDLCAWNWRKQFTGLQGRRTQQVTVAAGRGWQPSGLSVRAATKYEYLASGAWQIAGDPEAIDADGDHQHRGRLVGVLMKDHRLGAEIELGTKGSFRLETDGDLYLRCRNSWNELAGDHGHVTVRFQLQGHNPPLCDAAGRGHTSPGVTCSSACSGRQ
jgi:hypothetical protein